MGRASRRLTPVALLLCGVCLGMAGCVEVSGGAVEARWDLRHPDGQRWESCEAARISTVRFVLSPVGGGEDPCTAGDRCSFPCSGEVGTTAFVIPEGQYAMSLQLHDPNGTALGPAQGVVAPAPISRHVAMGELTELSVHMIIVDR